MTKSDFTKHMKILKDYLRKENKLDRALRDLSPDFGGFHINSLTSNYVALIEELMGDKYQSVSYYVWETDWGTNHCCPYNEEDEAIPFSTLSEVYDYIVWVNKDV